MHQITVISPELPANTARLLKHSDPQAVMATAIYLEKNMTDNFHQSEFEYLSDVELRSKFNEVAEQLAYVQNESQKLVITLRNIQAIIHRRRY